MGLYPVGKLARIEPWDFRREAPLPLLAIVDAGERF